LSGCWIGGRDDGGCVLPHIAERSSGGGLLRKPIVAAQKDRKSSWEYRPAIDGLRSIAVISVLFFHFDRRLLGGGFVGVDVFFVISGYLLTSILLKEIQDQDFSITRFYQRRIARIFPAFFIVIVFTLGFCSIIYSAQDFASLGANAVAAAVSAINIKLLFQGSYFQLSDDAQPILHYWSLAVEEQFYIVFPIYLYLITRFKRTFLINFLVCAASFVACVVVTHYSPIYAFYLLPTRAWELLAGSSLAIFERQRSHVGDQVAMAASWGGLALLALSFFTLDEGANFPGWIAFLPVLGTILVLSAVSNHNIFLTRSLSNPFAVFTGKLSYSLYLWHWPVFSLVDYRFFLSTNLLRAVLKIAITLFASIATYYLVERPLRSYFSRPSKKSLTFGNAFANWKWRNSGCWRGCRHRRPCRRQSSVNVWKTTCVTSARAKIHAQYSGRGWRQRASRCSGHTLA
jgi:peptidoglycan/LPS O-acetylase OafA/YrhL